MELATFRDSLSLGEIGIAMGVQKGDRCMSQTQPSPDTIRRLAYEISDMKITNALKVKLLSPKGKLPIKGTNLAAGYDLSSAQQIIIPANGRALVQTDISISVPKGTYGRIAPRSSLAVKHGITTGAGVIDADYTGPIGILLFNHGSQDFNAGRRPNRSTHTGTGVTVDARNLLLINQRDSVGVGIGWRVGRRGGELNRYAHWIGERRDGSVKVSAGGVQGVKEVNEPVVYKFF